MIELELDVTALAAGGEGVARDADGRVTFVPRTAPGDRVRARLVRETKSFARAELVDVLVRSPARVEPPCPHFTAGCGGCQWQHVARADQLAAKHAIVVGALRKLADVRVHPIADPAPPYGWRRRARFHVRGGVVGLYADGSHRVLPIVACPQLEPALDAALAAVRALSPPDGELALVRGQRGDIVVGVERAWRGAAAIVGKAGIVGVVAAGTVYGERAVQLESDLACGPWEFAQPSAAGNAALVALARGALGRGPGRLVELYAGGGNLTRAFTADGWQVLATDVSGATRDGFVIGDIERVIAELAPPVDALALDPPRTGASATVLGHVARLAPRTIVYVSCDPATLGRDASRLADAGYRATDAWPLDLMPQTAHVEIVMKLVRADAAG